MHPRTLSAILRISQPSEQRVQRSPRAAPRWRVFPAEAPDDLAHAAHATHLAIAPAGGAIEIEAPAVTLRAGRHGPIVIVACVQAIQAGWHRLVLARADKARPVRGGLGPHPHTGFGASGRMATAVNPLRVDGRRSAANVQVCGWGPRNMAWHCRADLRRTRRGALHGWVASSPNGRRRIAVKPTDSSPRSAARCTPACGAAAISGAGLSCAPHGTVGATRAAFQRRKD